MDGVNFCVVRKLDIPFFCEPQTGYHFFFLVGHKLDIQVQAYSYFSWAANCLFPYNNVNYLKLQEKDEYLILDSKYCTQKKLLHLVELKLSEKMKANEQE